MNIGLGIGWATTDIDFWSYASGLDKRVEEDDAALEKKSQEEEAREGIEAVAHFEEVDDPKKAQPERPSGRDGLALPEPRVDDPKDSKHSLLAETASLVDKISVD